VVVVISGGAGFTLIVMWNIVEGEGEGEIVGVGWWRGGGFSGNMFSSFVFFYFISGI